VAWSQTPDTPLPGADEPWLRVVVTGQPGSERALDELITADKPAHVPHELEVFDDHRLP
jgi:hypothetical protein